MIKKTKHPTNKFERRVIEKKKKVHSNASPVFKLLAERELHDNAPRLSRDRTDTEPSERS